MDDLQPDETIVKGEWITSGEQVSANKSCLRIEWLIKNRLNKVAISRDGWEALYEDPKDNRQWILYYPNREHHNGGAPCLRLAKNSETQYNFITLNV